MTQPKVIALFPEASYGAALNCVGIAQQLRSLGARPVFICHPGFRGVFAEYGFPEYPLPTLGSEGQTDWTDFINRHQDAFRQTPLEQIKSYIGPTWDAIVDTAIAAEEPLRQLLAQLKPAAIVLDNVVMFPAIANAGVPWVRIISCAETELPDAAVPPYLSGCRGEPGPDWMLFAEKYQKAVAPAHRRMNAFLAECGLKARPSGEFLESSPFLNLLLSPDAVRFEREKPLDPATHVYLNGCVRQEAPYPLPAFATHRDAALILVSFGSLGAMDVSMIKRMIGVFEDMPYRFIVNVGPWRDDYARVPDNVFLESWFPQPSVVEQASLFIHHGGNNSFCEALYYGVPSLIMPYCWDGHDNARRAQDVGVGQRIDRYEWTDAVLKTAVASLLDDAVMRQRLRDNAKLMKQSHGVAVAAKAIVDLL
ncbi:nucleotide disphospho-sugar-binding domain-containing protein [Pararhizobium antarcticum]|uniref:Glycosyl transferase family 1 n=1 Tax=Pararhizobium antarcticum TaxID=1798805 RepID=A0A657LN08_9HYPH|nr:glycosyltransferase [Pararhizobium antarcticum]OJF90707.1 glycosyl transferase family 1 [Rhizobium sp. 58]OJF91390.1 glycosyl transferase family 1 [Pararhizobium antarcticum]